MNTEVTGTGHDENFINNMVESALRIGLIFILVIWSYEIVKPFVIPIVWGAIIAVALMPIARLLAKLLGGRQSLAVTLLTLISITALVWPTIIVSESLVGSAQTLAAAFEEGNVEVPDVPENVAEWPIVGKPIAEFWSLASTNLEAALTKIEPQMKAVGAWLLGTVASGITGVLLFTISILIAGLFMAKADSMVAGLKRLATRIAGDNGPEWVDLSGATVRSVMQGVLGVAVIQAFLAALGLFIMDVPGAGLWSVLILLLAIMQLPPLLVLAPIIAYVFSYADTTPAVLFTIWSIFAGISDAFLKPMMLGRGVAVPMPVILLGAIGGMIASGIVGLFVGAVILALWYKLFTVWMAKADA